MRRDLVIHFSSNKLMEEDDKKTNQQQKNDEKPTSERRLVTVRCYSSGDLRVIRVFAEIDLTQ